MTWFSLQRRLDPSHAGAFSNRRRLTAAVCAVALAVAACGSDGDSAEPVPAQDAPQNSGGESDAGVVIVANANIDNGSAGRMADALSLAGFETGSVVTATEKIDRSVVFYINSDRAAETARQVGKIMGGLPVLSLLGNQVWTEAGTLDGGGVLVMLGQNEADRTLDDLNGGGTGGGGTGGGNDSPIGGTVECSESAVRAGLGDINDDIVSVDSLNCQEGWAVIEYTLSSGTPGFGNSVLEAEGQFWILKDKAAVCGTITEYDEDGQAIRPDDAQVPASLWRLPCATN